MAFTSAPVNLQQTAFCVIHLLNILITLNQLKTGKLALSETKQQTHLNMMKIMISVVKYLIRRLYVCHFLHAILSIIQREFAHELFELILIFQSYQCWLLGCDHLAGPQGQSLSRARGLSCTTVELCHFISMPTAYVHLASAPFKQLFVHDKGQTMIETPRGFDVNKM